MLVTTWVLGRPGPYDCRLDNIELLIERKASKQKCFSLSINNIKSFGIKYSMRLYICGGEIHLLLLDATQLIHASSWHHIFEYEQFIIGLQNVDVNGLS